MTPEQWAEQFTEDWGMTMETMRDLQSRFAAAIAAENEACAKTAETMPVFAAPKDVAAAIRARNEGGQG